MANPLPRDSGATVAARPRPVAISSANATGPQPVVRVAPIERANEALPGPLRGIPVQALLAYGGIVAVASSVFIAAALRSTDAVTILEESVPAETAGAAPSAPAGTTASATATAAPTAAPTGVSAKDLDAARAGGVEALVALATRYPNDELVLESIVVAGAKDKKDHAAALRALHRLLEVHPNKIADEDVRQALLELAAGPRETSADAFDLMKNRLGSAGPDLLFELAQKSPSPTAKTLAIAALRDPGVQKRASKALLVAEDLRRNLPCARKPFVARAGADGDMRAVPFLKEMILSNCPKKGLTAIFGGGSSDCFACILPADRAAITATIQAIESRAKR
jgi:hypothetical protein